MRLAVVRTLSLSVLLLAGCATIQPPPVTTQQQAETRWQAHRERVDAIQSFSVRGRIAGGAGIKADLQWQQQADGQFEMRMSGPLGVGAVSVMGDDHRVQITTRKGTTQTEDPEGWIEEQMGWRLPLRGLRCWVRGVPSPASQAQLQLDADGRAQQLEQDGWRITYQEYAESSGYWLPRKLEAAIGDTRVKILADEWSGLP